MENSYTEKALQAISKSLNDGINDLEPVTVTIVSVIILIIALSIIIGLRNKKKTRISAETSYQKLIRKYNLTILELDLLDKLANTQKRPEEKYQLLVNKNTLRYAENKTDFLNENEKKMLTQLKKKLGFIAPPESEFKNSTRSFTQGQPVKLKVSDNDYADAEIYSVSESNITVKYPHQNTPVVPDKELLLFTSNFGTFKVFKLQPDKIKEELFTAPHVESEDFQKLNPRIDVVIEAEVESEENSSEKMIEIKMTIVFLSPESAFLYDKLHKLKPADNVRIFFSNDIKKQYPVHAEILKTSEEKKLASAKFMT